MTPANKWNRHDLLTPTEYPTRAIHRSYDGSNLHPGRGNGMHRAVRRIYTCARRVP